MSKLFLAVTILLASIPAFSSSFFKKEWATCKETKDCIVAGHPCGEPYAIHKKYYEEFFIALGPSPIECPTTPPPDLGKATCKNSVCVVIKTKK